MAFDGTVIASLVKELNDTIQNGRISKIAQPEQDELLLTIKGAKGQVRLVLSASASLPLVYLTNENKPSPMTAPNFCMLLRKHIANGKITRISQPHMERIINFEIEHLNELGDPCQKTLVVEIMGKHSNLIFCKEDGKIIDSIKHVSAQVSSVREVLPGRDYFIPETQEKYNPLEATQESFLTQACAKPLPVQKAIYTTYTGISPVIASELCFRASVDADRPMAALSKEEKLHLYHHFSWLMEDIKEGRFVPNIIRNGKEPIDFSAVELKQYEDYSTEHYPSISKVLETYYAAKNSYTRIRQKSADLRKIVSTVLDRERKKYDLQQKQLKDTEKREKYKVYGELIHTYGYGLPEGATQLEALDYYTDKTITIPLDAQLTPLENAQKYFDRYNKLKRTYEALIELIQETRDEILHLDSISTALDIAVSEDDLTQIKEELTRFGYIKKKHTGKKEKVKSKPFHYISSDGFHIYVGKNNFQNEELTFKFASGNDWWFHAKGIPGSHVVVKTNGEELPDRTFEEAGQLAAYYSKGRENEKVEIDYLERKHVKKPNGSKPGFVVYYTNYSLVASPDISGLKTVSD
ncbi:NFACT RNA binding domain-containing protein [Lachnospiraceae bacterium 29-84]